MLMLIKNIQLKWDINRYNNIIPLIIDIFKNYFINYLVF